MIFEQDSPVTQIKELISQKKSKHFHTFGLPKIVEQQFVSEVSTYVIYRRQVSSGWYVPKIIKIS